MQHKWWDSSLGFLRVAALSNPALKRDAAKARRPLILRYLNA